MPFKIDFCAMLVDFGVEIEPILALKWDLKSIFSLNSVKPKKHYDSCIFLVIWGGLGVPKSTKN